MDTRWYSCGRCSAPVKDAHTPGTFRPLWRDENNATACSDGEPHAVDIAWHDRHSD